MTDKQIIIDNDISNFVLVCYYDKSTNELVHIEQYGDNSGDIETDIKSYEYGYNAEIIKPEELFKQLTRKTQECEELKNKLIQKDEINTFFNTPIEGWDNDPCKICESKQNYEQLKAENEECKKLNDISILHRICLDDDLQQAEQKLKKIKDRCKETLELMDKDSGTNAYAGGRCTEAVQILQIIDEVE